MIIYSTTNKDKFLSDQPTIDRILKDRLASILHEEPSDNEVLSWKNSLAVMADVIKTPKIPENVGVFIEYNIPSTDNRVDFILTGADDMKKENIVMVELKQWQHVEKTSKTNIVRTKYEEGYRDVNHPSYQVFSYAYLMYSNCVPVQDKQVILKLCTFLHNCEDKPILMDPFYDSCTKHAKVFCKDDRSMLVDFIASNLKKGDGGNGIDIVENGEHRPPKGLGDALCNMVAGKREFMMIGRQNVIYANVLEMHKIYEETGQKQVMIVSGGPGTGKSVIGVQLEIEATKRGWNAKYVTKNAQPRNVYTKLLYEGRNTHMYKIAADNLFKGSMSSCFGIEEQYDLLIVDEAHRLINSAPAYNNTVDDQMTKLMAAAKTIVYFIDENQRVTLRDAGTIKGIEERACMFHAKVMEDHLDSQFRCSGSNGYLQWVDSILQINKIHPFNIKNTGYDFRVMDTPEELMKAIRQRNARKNKSRVVAGYCWRWLSKKDPRAWDIKIGDFKVRWNEADDKTWSISKGSSNRVGCIHTCQGLEFEYVGVIIGKDIIYRNGKILVDPKEHATDDPALWGWKQYIKDNGDKGRQDIKKIIKNTYRTLLTRGMSGCYVYIMDPELREYIKSNI